MSLKYLGNTIDIHGGGQDLIFPHHENEIAQTESFTGVKPFVKYWMHNGLVQLGGEKMSKSLGNLITIKEGLKKYSADALRIFVLSSHYRSPLTFSEEVVLAAKSGVERLLRVISREEQAGAKGETLNAEPYRRQFEEAMDDDFNSPQALAALFDLARAINQAGDAGMDYKEARKMMVTLARDVLGLRLEEAEMTAGPDAETRIRVSQLIEERNQARQAKKWQKADELRDELASQGIVLEDTPKGTIAFWQGKKIN